MGRGGGCIAKVRVMNGMEMFVSRWLDVGIGHMARVEHRNGSFTLCFNIVSDVRLLCNDILSFNATQFLDLMLS